MPYIRVEADEDIGEVARQLVGIARAEDLPMPETESSGPRIAFIVSQELYDSYKGAPAPKAAEEKSAEESSNGDSADADGDSGSAKSRKSKGSK